MESSPATNEASEAPAELSNAPAPAMEEVPGSSACGSDPVPEASVAAPEAAGPPAELVDFTLVYGKSNTPVSRPANSTVGQLKADVEQRLQIPIANQKLLCGGKALKDDGATLQQSGIKKGSKVMLLGSSPAALQATSSSGAGDETKWDDKAESKEPISKQKQHAKVLEKGLPEDAMPSVKGRQVPLAAEVTCMPGILNSQGVKVRLTFKEELRQLWIASATTTQKVHALFCGMRKHGWVTVHKAPDIGCTVPYASITKIENYPIEGQEEYSIVALVLGSGASSKYWLYFVPSQHIAALKIRICGVESLL